LSASDSKNSKRERGTYLAKHPVRTIPMNPPPVCIKKMNSGSLLIKSSKTVLLRKNMTAEAIAPMQPALQTGT
jgi:hypothetical protein